MARSIFVPSRPTSAVTPVTTDLNSAVTSGFAIKPVVTAFFFILSREKASGCVRAAASCPPARHHVLRTRVPAWSPMLPLSGSAACSSAQHPSGTTYILRIAYAMPFSVCVGRRNQLRATRLVPRCRQTHTSSTHITSPFAGHSLLASALTGWGRGAGPSLTGRPLIHAHRPATAQQSCAGIGSHQPVCRSFAVLSADIASSCLT